MVGNVLELVKSFQGRLLETKRKKEFWIFTNSEIMQTSYILKYARYELLIAIIGELDVLHTYQDIDKLTVKVTTEIYLNIHHLIFYKNDVVLLRLSYVIRFVHAVK